MPDRLTFLQFSNADTDGFIRLQSAHPQLPEHGFIAFRLIHGYRITKGTGGWAVHTVNYKYELQVASGREIVAYHFDPDRGRVRTPHLHVRGLTAPLPLSKVHFPTGRVSIEDVIRLAITELRVRPRLPDGQWQSLLEETEEEFKTKTLRQ